ncbi:MAG: BrnT family toxin [Armatimonadetes bacterium]|nr:BrnT family toxin [Armatimonadota bacterium]
MDLLFEWDEDKARHNETKHGVSFDEGRTVFNDPSAITVSDPDHSEDEDRWIDIGFSAKGRLLVVWYTERGERIRLIGCRNATSAEAGCYRNE